MKTILMSLWQEIYGEANDTLLESLITDLEALKARLPMVERQEEWYRDVVVYALYVDRFNQDFAGLCDRLDYLKDLGISCLWLLPILDSPMRDAGFDIRDFRTIRKDLLPKENSSEAFTSFVSLAHQKGIRIIFDIALNHTSDQHPWFQEARKSPDNRYRDYYIWRTNDQQYQEARVIFQGIESSNWKKDDTGVFFHRFFDFQPDLNYRKPEVLIEMCHNLLFWIEQGVDGFRADAIPYLWKEVGTPCENLDQTHTLVKFFRAVLDATGQNVLLLAEACQKPYDVVQYFGQGDECHAGYHFPLMPQIFKSIASGNSGHIVNILDPANTPPLPSGNQWFTFLRCHDELSLELVYVSEEDRAYLHDHYCRNPLWDFREGQGISARLADLLENDPRKIGLAFSLMLSLPGTPVIYYGDEFAQPNDEAYYQEQISKTGKDDTRFLVRGNVDWERVEEHLTNEESVAREVFIRLKTMLDARTSLNCFGRGDLKYIKSVVTPYAQSRSILAFERKYLDERVVVVHNLSAQTLQVKLPDGIRIKLEPYGYQWITKTHSK